MFKKLTLKKYIDLVALEKEPNDYKRKYKKVALYLGLSFDEVIQLDIKYINDIANAIDKQCKPLSFKKTIFIDGMLLKATTSINDMKPAQLVDYYNLFKAGAPLNDLLAIMYVPYLKGYQPKKHGKISQALRNTKIEKTLGLLFFWLDYSQKCEKPIQIYLAKQTQIIKEMMTEIQADAQFQDSLKTGAGNTK